MKKALFISCFNWYKTRIKPIRDIMAKRGYQVTVLIADFDHIKKETVNVKYEECTYISVPSYNKNLSLQRIYSHFKFGKEVNQYILQIQPDFLYVQVPPNNVAQYCTKYKLSNQTSRLYLDIIDLWPESIPLKFINSIPGIKIWKKWRNECVIASDHTFTECNLYKNELSEIGDASKVSTLYLFRERTNDELIIIKRIISEFKRESNNIKLAYLGSINSIIDIDGICSILKGFINQGFYTEIHVIGTGESVDELKKRVSQTGCVLHFYGAIYDACRIAEILAPCDFGLNLMKTSTKIGLTTKSVHYFSLGLPIINNIKGDTWRIVEDCGIGINVDSYSTKGDIFKKNIDKCNVLKCFDDMFSYNAFWKSISKVISE